jgi:hypothetical protein
MVTRTRLNVAFIRTFGFPVKPDFLKCNIFLTGVFSIFSQIIQRKLQQQTYFFNTHDQSFRMLHFLIITVLKSILNPIHV